MRSRLIGSAPSVPGEKSFAGPSWHGLARCGGWHGLARFVGSTARTARQKRRRAHRGGAVPTAPTRGPQTWWAKMAEVLVAATVGAARERAA
eukprot:scaffold4843_cov42-Phaeocystis_antarctica.AAC.4